MCRNKYLWTIRLATILALLIATFTVIAAEPDETVALNKAEMERALAALEDPDRRAEITRTLRALIAATAEEAEDQDNVTTAAADLLALISDKASEVSRSTGVVIESLYGLPDSLGHWLEMLENPEHRRHLLTIAWRLLLVLGAGFAAAAIVMQLRRRGQQQNIAAEDPISLMQRVLRLSVHLLYDLLPIAAFAVVSYGMLTLVDPRQETRLVAIALINASIFSRLLMAVAAFFLSPRSGARRLWSIPDESANYLFQWTQRLTAITIYGFFGLQAGLLLGMELSMYEALLRSLGLVILALLLVLIAQNRHDVAAVISTDYSADIDAPLSNASIRRGFARVWHLLASLYLVVIFGVWALRIENGSAYLVRATLLSLIALALGRLLANALDQIFDKGLHLSDELQHQFPDLERRLNRYFPTLKKISTAVLLAGVTLFIADAWGVDTLQWISQGAGKAILGALLQILLLLGFAFVFWELASGSIERYLAETDADGQTRVRSARTRTLLTVARNALLVVLSIVTLLMVLSELGINIAPLLAGAGVAGLAIGFGAQRLVQDVINGAFILFQDLMSVGDVVKLGDKAGTVEALSIRTVRLRDLAGVVHTIPFSGIEAVSNLTREFSYHVFELGIAYRENIDEVIELIEEVGEELQYYEVIGPLMLEPLEVLGVDQFGDSAIVIKGRIKTTPNRQWQVGRAFNRLIKLRFDENNIEIPYPHQTIYFGQNKDGSAPPAAVRFEESKGTSGLDSSSRQSREQGLSPTD